MERLSSKVFSLAESPRWSNVRKGLLFTDINNKELMLYAEGRLNPVFSGVYITSFSEEPDGSLVCGTFDGLFSLSLSGEFKPLFTESMFGMPLKINDMCADPKGRIIFGTNFHNNTRRFPLGRLYSYDGITIKCLDDSYQLVNGIGFSPDGAKMYVCDSAIRTIYEYDYDSEKAAVGDKRVFARIPVDDGIPDGMAVDADGNVFTAQWYGKCVLCHDPEGKEIQRIPVPEWQVSAVELANGGIFIMTANERGRLDIAPHAFCIDEPANGGGIYFEKLNGTRCRAHAASHIL